MKMRLSTLAALLASALVSLPVLAIDNGNFRSNQSKPITLAVFGDWPYSQYLLDNASLLVNSINNDTSVNLVMHVGDIHSGSNRNSPDMHFRFCYSRRIRSIRKENAHRHRILPQAILMPELPDGWVVKSSGLL